MAKEWAKQFYNSSAWKFTRRQVLRRDKFTCAHCCGRANEVHHITELTPQNINDDKVSLNPDNLMSLCRDCHSRITKNQSDIVGDYIFDENGFIIPPVG